MKRRHNPPWAKDLERYKARYNARPDPVDTLLAGYYGGRGVKRIPRFACILPHIVGPRVLDIGCDGGILSRWMYEQGFGVVGLDIAEHYIVLNRTRLPQITWMQIAFEETDFSEEFDTIVFSEVLEHVIDPRAFLLRAYESLKLGGRVVGTVPQMGKMHEAGRWYEEDEHLWAFDQAGLADLLNEFFVDVAVWGESDDMFWAFKALKG